MHDIYSSIQIIPLSKCLAHEGIVKKWVDQIASNIKNDGIMKNPIIVKKHENSYIVLDGMHRFAALMELEIRDILACEVDYFSNEIVLEGWDAITFKRLGASSLLAELFPERSGYRTREAAHLAKAKFQVLNRHSLLTVADKGGAILTLEKLNLPPKDFVEELCVVTDRIDRILNERNVKLLYVDDALQLKDFSISGGDSVILRPRFTKQEVMDRTLNKKLFPPKSTRHLIPERPLHVDLDLALLRSDIDLATKNRLLQDHLRWRYENNRVRFYPESVTVFAD